MKSLLVIAAALILAACSREAPPSPPPPPASPADVTPPPPPPEPAAAPKPETAETIAAYVDGIEAEFRGKYQQSEVPLTAEMLKDVTTASWEKMHVYRDGGEVKRIKLYPAAGTTKVEEFYFRDGQLVYVSVEPQGTAEGGREQLYFDAGALIAIQGADGKAVTVGDAEQQRGSKMLTEASALLAIAEKGTGQEPPAGKVAQPDRAEADLDASVGSRAPSP